MGGNKSPKLHSLPCQGNNRQLSRKRSRTKSLNYNAIKDHLPINFHQPHPDNLEGVKKRRKGESNKFCKIKLTSDEDGNEINEKNYDRNSEKQDMEKETCIEIKYLSERYNKNHEKKPDIIEILDEKQNDMDNKKQLDRNEDADEKKLMKNIRFNGNSKEDLLNKMNQVIQAVSENGVNPCHSLNVHDFDKDRDKEDVTFRLDEKLKATKQRERKSAKVDKSKLQGSRAEYSCKGSEEWKSLQFLSKGREMALEERPEKLFVNISADDNRLTEERYCTCLD